MENASRKSWINGVLAALLALTVSELGHFFQKGGLEHPLCLSLLKIILFLFFFLLLYFERGTEFTEIQNVLRVLLEDLKRLKDELL